MQIKTLESIDSKIKSFTEAYSENQARISTLLDTLKLDTVEGEMQIKPKKTRDEAPVLVIDTSEGTNAMSYRDALMAAAPDLELPSTPLELPRPSDLVIPGANRLIVKMRDQNNLEKFKSLIDSDPNLGKLAQAKISRRRKHRLILFGVPDEISENDFKTEVEALGETMGKPITIIKSFKNGKVVTQTQNFIIEVEAQVAENLLKLSRFVLNFNRIRIQRYFNILRCFKCQRFGHAAHSCSWDTTCAKCAGAHDTRQCDSGSKVERCANCLGNRTKAGAQKFDHHHRADSRLCDSYLDYKHFTITKND
ncbi:hypothetical protein JTE90_018880 [Oedothorax gibbosus]|uniref:CCHC-type domain-containing protein n=1 Tax=Oedothorax gibbosus TaxID=931172 RepID=A0AAV6TU29_9ARAC|nr:hypothetical protein JTE90_018880 [Oedothorax gibbosus]